MRRRSRITEGRRDSLGHRALVYGVLIVGSIPILLPLYWLVLASLKSRDRLNVEPPDWIPIEARDWIVVDDQDIPVSVFDDGRAAGTKVARVKMISASAGPETGLMIPRARIRVETTREYKAIIEGVSRRIEPAAATDLDALPAEQLVDVRIIGSPRQDEVSINELRRDERPRTWWTVFGIELPVEPELDPLPAGGVVLVRWSGEAPAIRVHRRLYEGGPTGAVRWRDRALNAEVLTRDAGGGYWTIRLTCPPQGAEVPAHELRQQRGVRWFLDGSGPPREVKLLERDDDRGTARIEYLDELQAARIPAGAIRVSNHPVFLTTIFGETHAVNPLAGGGNLPLLRHGSSVTTAPSRTAPPYDSSPDPAADEIIPVHVPGVISIAADKVRHERWLAPQWRNYAAAAREQRFDLYIANTLFVAALVVLGTVLSCGLVGYAFARLEFRGRDALFLLLLSTLMIPGQVTSIPTFVLYAKLGWIDSYKPLIVPSFLAASAFFVFLFRQFMMTIPVDLEDSARIDGCGPLATWWLIMMPLCRPIVVTVAVFAFIGVWNDFLGPLLYINSDEKQTVALGLQNFKSAFQGDDPQLIMAASVMMILPAIVLFFIAQKAFIRGVVVTGVKG